MTIESCCKNCLSVNTDGDALIFTGVLIEGQRYDVRLECRDAAGNVIKVPENTQYLKATIEKVVDLSAKLFTSVDSSARFKVHFSYEKGKNPIYKDGDSTVELSQAEVQDSIRAPLDKILDLFQEPQQYANLDESQIIQVKWQKPSDWQLPPSQKSASSWAPAPSPPKNVEKKTEPKKLMTKEQLTQKVKEILNKPMDGLLSGRAWEPVPTPDPLEDNLKRLYGKPDSNQGDDQEVRKWLLQYYHTVHQLFKDQGSDVHKESKSELSFEDWCEQKTLENMFGSSTDDVRKIVKSLINTNNK